MRIFKIWIYIFFWCRKQDGKISAAIKVCAPLALNLLTLIFLADAVSNRYMELWHEFGKLFSLIIALCLSALVFLFYLVKKDFVERTLTEFRESEKTQGKRRKFLVTVYYILSFLLLLAVMLAEAINSGQATS